MGQACFVGWVMLLLYHTSLLVIAYLYDPLGWYNANMSFYGISNLTIADIQSILTLILSSVAVLSLFIGVGFIVWQYLLYKKLMVSEQAIRDKQKEIDNVELSVNGRISGCLVNEKQRVAMVKKGRTPKLRELELLREERDFIKDKLLFAKK